jgi:hypothetical protein
MSDSEEKGKAEEPQPSYQGGKSIHISSFEEMEDERRRYSASLSYAERIIFLENLRLQAWQMQHNTEPLPRLKRIITLRAID